MSRKPPAVTAVTVSPTSATTIATPASAHPRLPDAAKRRANTRHAAITVGVATAVANACSIPCQARSVAWPSGVPGGKSSVGSATKTPPHTSAAPYRPSRMGPHARP
ncbi:MAG: hypothetical protein K0R62_4852 [Nonomuraea muscovyensis]|nr:hypothetical protein [Nonomuraea muscovyensis]